VHVGANWGFLVVAIISFVLVIILWKFRRKIADWILPRKWKFLLKIVEWLLALAGAVISDYAEVFKHTSWGGNQPTYPVEAVLAILGLGVLFLTVGQIRDELKEDLEESLNTSRQQSDELKRQRDAWVRLLVHIRNIIDKKMKRVETLAKNATVSHEEFVTALNPDEQVMLILQSIYEFFKFELHALDPNAQLRLALYMREEGRMAPAYSWNGSIKNCVSTNTKQMELGSPDGVISVVVQCYNIKGDTGVIIIPDCDADKGFEFFRPEQKKYLKSMLALKYRTEHDGTADALVLALDCDRTDFFDTGRSEELKTFLFEMMKRIDYELVIADVAAKVTAKPL